MEYISIKEKKHRLEKEFYIGEIAVAFTCCIEQKKELFSTPVVFEVFEKILLNELIVCNLGSLVHLFMPNHLHIITLGKSSSSNPLLFMKNFKQKTGFWHSKSMNHFKWQKNFYDHIIRDDEDLINQIYYILNNPVRKEMVEHWNEYPYIGSTEYNLNEID